MQMQKMKWQEKCIVSFRSDVWTGVFLVPCLTSFIMICHEQRSIIGSDPDFKVWNLWFLCCFLLHSHSCSFSCTIFDSGDSKWMSCVLSIAQHIVAFASTINLLFIKPLTFVLSFVAIAAAAAATALHWFLCCINDSLHVCNKTSP